MSIVINKLFSSTFKNLGHHVIFAGGAYDDKAVLAAMVAASYGSNVVDVNFIANVRPEVKAGLVYSIPALCEITHDRYTHWVECAMADEVALVNVIDSTSLFNCQNEVDVNMMLERTHKASKDNGCDLIEFVISDNIISHLAISDKPTSPDTLFSINRIPQSLYHNHNLSGKVVEGQRVVSITCTKGLDESVVGKSIYLVIDNQGVSYIHSALLNLVLSKSGDDVAFVGGNFIAKVAPRVKFIFNPEAMYAPYKNIIAYHLGMGPDHKMGHIGDRYEMVNKLSVEDYAELSEHLTHLLFN